MFSYIVSFKCAYYWKRHFTLETTVRFLICMNSYYMFLQVSFQSKWLCTLRAAERFPSGGNSRMLLQVNFQGKQLRTLGASKWILSLPCNFKWFLSSYEQENVLAQCLHLRDSPLLRLNQQVRDPDPDPATQKLLRVQVYSQSASISLDINWHNL
jgi:hypothetical protein